MFMSVIFLTLNSVLKHCLSLWCHFCCKVLFCPNQKNSTFLYAHAAFVLIRMLLLHTCRAEFIISGHRSYAPITGKEVISQASLQSHLLFLFAKPAKAGVTTYYKFLTPCFKQRKPHAFQKLLMSIRKWRFFEIVQTQNFTAKNVPQRRVCFKEFKARNIMPWT